MTSFRTRNLDEQDASDEARSVALCSEMAPWVCISFICACSVRAYVHTYAAHSHTNHMKLNASSVLAQICGSCVFLEAYPRLQATAKAGQCIAAYTNAYVHAAAVAVRTGDSGKCYALLLAHRCKHLDGYVPNFINVLCECSNIIQRLGFACSGRGDYGSRRYFCCKTL
jgi:hypothetical protein